MSKHNKEKNMKNNLKSFVYSDKVIIVLYMEQK